MVNIQEYKDKRIKWIEELVVTAGLESFEVSDAVREMAKAYPDLKNWAEKMSTWRDSILDTDSLDAVDVYYNGYVKLIENLMKKKHDKQRQEWQDDAQKNKEWWEDYYKKEQTNKEWLRKYLAGELDWQKDQKKKDEENRKKLEESEKNRKNDEKERGEEWKKKFIGDIEMDLIKKNISQERLSKRLGVSDWKEKISGAADFHEALSRRSDLWDIIRELKDDSDKEFTCAGCGREKQEYYKYPLEGGKKYCSSECWNKGENGKDKGKNNNPPTNYGNNFGFSSVSEFFAWMKKIGVEKIEFDFNTNQVVISCKGNKKLNVSDDNVGLTNEQQTALTERFKSEKEPITFGQIQSELGKGNSKKSNTAMISIVVVIGVIFVVIVGVVVRKSKKKDY